MFAMGAILGDGRMMGQKKFKKVHNRTAVPLQLLPRLE